MVMMYTIQYWRLLFMYMAKPHADLCNTINCNKTILTRFQVNKIQPNYPVAVYVLHMLQRLILANPDHVKTMECARSADLGLLASA